MGFLGFGGFGCSERVGFFLTKTKIFREYHWFGRYLPVIFRFFSVLPRFIRFSQFFRVFFAFSPFFSVFSVFVPFCLFQPVSNQFQPIISDSRFYFIFCSEISLNFAQLRIFCPISLLFLPELDFPKLPLVYAKKYGGVRT